MFAIVVKLLQFATSFQHMCLQIRNKSVVKCIVVAARPVPSRPVLARPIPSRIDVVIHTRMSVAV